MRIDPVSLKLFVAVLEEGTIAKAAEREHIAAAAISKRIHDLETTLGTQLIYRSNKGSGPTMAGATLLKLARDVLQELDEIWVQISDFASGIRGVVRVVANISAITQFIPAALKSFLEEYPLIQVRLEEMTSHDVLRAVADNSADIGFLSSWPKLEGVETYPFRHDELVVVAPQNHPVSELAEISFVDALEYQFVGLHPNSSINLQLMRIASEHGKSMKLRIRVSSFDALCLMVDAGLGLGILPRKSVEPYTGTLGIKVVNLTDAWAKRELMLCVRSYESLSNAGKLFFNHLN